MSAINFPSSPYVNQIFTVGPKSWQWDGSVWNAYYNESPDMVYGTGMDGDAILDGTTTVLGIAPSVDTYLMERDMYFNDLTINSGVALCPMGYRVFVKGTLKFAGADSMIGFGVGIDVTGSIKGGGAAITTVPHSLGGSGTYGTCVPPTAAMGGSNYFKVPHQAITGYSVTASGGPTFLRGGGAGGSGDDAPGGNVVIVAARYISGPPSGTAYIKAKGIGGAGGGVVIVVSSSSAMPSGISVDVSGQNPGTHYYLQQV
jgi:hypothetical protein